MNISLQYSLLFTPIILASIFVSITDGWVGPTSTPPNENVDKPLNVGSTSQTKPGNLGAYGLFLTGTAPQYINFSSTLGPTGFGIRNNSGTLEYKNSSGSWTALGGGGSQWTTSGSNIYYNSGDVRIGSAVDPQEKLHVTGNILQDNTNTLRAKNSAGAVETWMWPRFSDNATYLNYGTGGLIIRNNASSVKMSINDSGNVAIGLPPTTPYPLTVFINSAIPQATAAFYNQSTAATAATNIAIGSGTLTSTIGISVHNNSGNPFAQINTQAGITAGIYYDTIKHLFRSQTGAVEYARIESTGNLGVGTSVPAAKVDAAGYVRSLDGAHSAPTTGEGVEMVSLSGTGYITSYNRTTSAYRPLQLYATVTDIISGTTALGLQVKAPGTIRLNAYGAGTLTTDASGNVTASSDERLKNIDGTFDKGIEAVLAINPIRYHWNTESGLDQAQQYTGFSAQNIQQALPEAVDTDPRGYLSLSDRPILATIVNAIKGIWAKMLSHDAELANLRAEVAALRSQITTLGQPAQSIPVSGENSVVSIPAPLPEVNQSDVPIDQQLQSNEEPVSSEDAGSSNSAESL